MPPENDQSAGATPAVGGATPPQTPPAQPAATPPATPPPATGDDQPLGAPGIRALETERAARREAEDAKRTAEKALDELKKATLSDTERAIAEAKTAGANEVTERAHAQIRRSEVKAALSGAGINASVMDLAAKADEFAKLKVNDNGEVEGLEEAVKAFKKARPDLFGKASGDGSADGGAQSSGQAPAKDLQTALDRHYNPSPH